jgi:ABC-type bacteriocin/lantibiotic exporter with double-glycine peptidase domain
MTELIDSLIDLYENSPKAQRIAKRILDPLANVTKWAEENLQRDKVILEGFPRSLQTDSYSCGVQCAYAVLKYFGKARSINQVTHELGTTSEDGTDEDEIKRLLKRRGLSVFTFNQKSTSQIENAIDSDAPVIAWMKTRREDHWVDVYGYSDEHIWLMDPSLLKTISCRQDKESFKRRWSGFGMIIRLK